jgi:hypothetical protein
VKKTELGLAAASYFNPSNSGRSQVVLVGGTKRIGRSKQIGGSILSIDQPESSDSYRDVE